MDPSQVLRALIEGWNEAIGISLPGSLAALVTIIIVGFGRAEALTNTLAKKELADLLKRMELTAPGRILAGMFRHAFIAVFGERHWSLRCLGASLIASQVLFVVLLLIWLSGVDQTSLPRDFWSTNTFFVILSLVVLINGVADYFSLWKARWIIDKIQGANFWRILAWLMIDALASLAIGCLAFILGVGIESVIEEIIRGRGLSVVAFNLGFELAFREGQRLVNAPSEFLSLFNVSEWSPPPSVWVYTTCLTCLWTCLFGASVLLLRIAHVVDPGWKWLGRRLVIDDKPFVVMGWISATLVSGVYVFYALILGLRRM